MRLLLIARRCDHAQVRKAACVENLQVRLDLRGKGERTDDIGVALAEQRRGRTDYWNPRDGRAPEAFVPVYERTNDNAVVAQRRGQGAPAVAGRVYQATPHAAAVSSTRQPLQRGGRARFAAKP